MIRPHKSKIAFSFQQIPLKAVKNGVLYTHQGYHLVLKVEPLNFELFSFNQQDMVLDMYRQFLTSLTSGVQILVQVRELNQRDYGQYLNDARASVNLLKDRQIFNRDFYLIVSQPIANQNQVGEAINQLHLQADLLARGLANLNLVTQRLSTLEALKLLYESYHPPLKISQNDFEAWQQQAGGSLLSLIGYRSLTEDIHHLRLNDTWVRTLSIAHYPARLTAGCLHNLIQANLNLDISYHLMPLDHRLAIYRLTRKITELESSKRNYLKSGRLIDETLTDPLEAALELRSQLQKRQEALLRLSIHISLYAGSKKELDQQTLIVKNILDSQLFEIQTSSFQQLETWQACLPLGLDDLDTSRNLDSSSLSLTFPFANTEIVHPDGILYGINQSHNSLVIVDRFSLPNANSVILAQSGSGKSYAMKVEILRQFQKGVSVFILDPENEYRHLVDELGGQVIDIARSQEVAINFLDLSLNPQLDKTEHITQAMQILAVMLEGLSLPEKALLDDALVQLYEYGSQPLLGDLHRLIEAKNPDLSLRLQRFTKGSLASIFNVETKFEAKSLTSFNLQNVTSDLRPTLMLILSFFISNQLRHNWRKRLLVIDEAWSLIKDSLAGEAINSLVRRARKYYLGVCLISQQASDFLDSEHGRALIAQSSLKLLLRQDAITIEEAIKQFHLSEYEKHFLLTADVGQALIVADRQHATVKIIASEEEHPLITTHPQEKEAGRA